MLSYVTELGYGDNYMWEERNVRGGVIESTEKVFQYIAECPDLEDRIGQRKMSKEIAKAIFDNKNLMVEAGVGIGKSFAYLIPAILYYHLERRPVIITTSSIALTEQLVDDVPYACNIINKALGKRYSINPVLAMGARNYVCKKKVNELIREYKSKSRKNGRDDIPYDVLIKSRLCDEKKNFKGRPSWWEQINGATCNRRECKEKNQCAYNAMRQAISNRGDAKFIIINHDMYITNLKNIRNGMDAFVNEYAGLVIVDEGHNLEEKTRSSLTIMKDECSCIKLMDKLRKRVGNIRFGVDKDNLYEEITHSKQNITIFFAIAKHIAKEYKKIGRKNEEATKFYPPREKDGIKIKQLKQWIRNLENVQTSIVLHDKSNCYEDSTLDELAEFIDLLNAYINDNKNVTWFQKDKDTGYNMAWCCAPQDINKELGMMLFEKMYLHPIIVTSATLTQWGEKLMDKYRYMIDSIGFKGRVMNPQKSPFMYENNAKLYIASNIQAPTQDENYTVYLDQMSEEIKRLVKITDGRTLVLFTSKKDMEYVGGILRRELLQYDLIIQSYAGSQERNVKDFKKSKGIMLSTGLWEGFNIIGGDLSSVIIAKLPFPVPDPIIERKIEMAGDKDKILIPEMLRKLRQGAGRLIRSQNDTGILTILDSRVLRADLFETVLNELPIKSYTTNINDIIAFAKNKIKF